MDKYSWFLELEPFAQAGVLTIATALVSFAFMFVMYCLPVILQFVLGLVVLYAIFYVAMKLVEEVRKE